MPMHFDHSQYDPNRPDWQQRSTKSYSTARPPEGRWMLVPTLLGWLNVASGVAGLLSVSFGVVFIVLMVGGATPLLLPLVAGGAFVLFFSLFYLRLGQGLLQREEWSRWVTSLFGVLALILTPCSMFSSSSQLEQVKATGLPPGIEAMIDVIFIGSMLFALAINAFIVYALSRQDVKVHFRSNV